MVRVVPEEPSHSIPQCIAPTYVSMYVPSGVMQFLVWIVQLVVAM